MIPVKQDIDRQESINEIKRKIEDVKAGKSTIINALIGGEFLPTRPEAMTALPIAVVLKLGETQVDGTSSAQLVLEDATVEALRNLRSATVKILKESFSDEKQLELAFHSNPHLVQTAKTLRDDQSTECHLQNRVEKNEEVKDAFTFINELARIALYLSSQQSDAEITDEINKVRRWKKNQECIYVLISKADLHKRKDISEDKLRQHVATTYGIPVERVFQLSGYHALIAQKFLADYRKDGHELIVMDSDAAQDVLEVYCPVRWEKNLDKRKPKQVKGYAECLYENSGISDVLESVLTTVVS